MKQPLFEKYAEDYACSRPGYPAEIRPFLFDRFSICHSSILVDIACGPGMFTQLLACEHDSALVTGIDRSLPLLNAGISYYRNFRFEAVCGCGELLPLKSESCDMISVAQAFHWMHQKESLSEIVRTLKRGGGLSIISYRRKDLKEPHQAFIENLTYQFNPNYDPAFMDFNYVEMLLNDGRFGEIGQKRFYSKQNYSLEKYLRWQRSKSYIGDAMEPDILDDFLNQVESGMRQFFPDGVITEEFKFDVVWARKS